MEPTTRVELVTCRLRLYAALNPKCLLNQAVSQFEDMLEIALLGAVVTKDVTRFYSHS
jgi:hypothetical protein